MISVLVPIWLINHFESFIDINECKSNPCGEFGTCIDKTAGYHCLCSEGFDGVHCDNNRDECSLNPCIYGSCEDGDNSFKCICDPGFSGDTCQMGMYTT